MQKLDIHQQLEIIKRGVVNIISEKELQEKLEESLRQKRPLNIKAGFDPTAADLHLGHTVLLRKLRQFQELGHRVFFLIGDFTARIGDPSGRQEARKPLSKEEVLGNAQGYKKQVSKILDLDKAQIVFNSKWFEKMQIADMLNLTTHATVAQMLAREDFKKRLSEGENISLLEFIYPLLQGYDSVKLEADIEIGGTDQIFNLLIGRDIQKDFGGAPQVIITMPLLEGTDGVQKMSKSYGNYIGINEAPSEIFGKIMSISDILMMKYYELLTDQDLDQIRRMHPKEAKIKLAKLIVGQYHSQEQAQKACLEFERVFSRKELPEEACEYKSDGKETIISILLNSKMVKSRNEARRLIKQQAILFNGQKIKDENLVLKEAGMIRIGSKRFLKLL